MSWIWKHSCANFDVNGRHICIKLEGPSPTGRKREKKFEHGQNEFQFGSSRNGLGFRKLQSFIKEEKEVRMSK